MAQLISPVGSWVATTQSSQGGTLQSLVSFLDGGVLIASETPNSDLSTYHGVWTSRDDGSVAFTFLGLYGDKQGAYAGSLKVVSEVTYDVATNTWSGPFKVETTYPDGSLNYADRGTSVLKRIEIERLD